MSKNYNKAAATITPLRMIFWGGILCLFDFTFSSTVNGSGWRFDILNDFVGILLITIGVVRLRRIDISVSYHKVMTFVVVVAVISCVDAALDHFIYQSPTFISFLIILLTLATLAAIGFFCDSMKRLCLEVGLHQSAKSWLTTFWLFVAIYLFPLGLFYLIVAGAMVTGESFNINLGPVMFLILLVFLIPLIHFFISTSRMKQEAQSMVNSSVLQ